MTKRRRGVSIAELGRAYDRAINLRERTGPPEGWIDMVEAARAFLESLNQHGVSVGTLHPDWPHERAELGNLILALAVAEQCARRRKDPFHAMAVRLLAAIDGKLAMRKLSGELSETKN